MDGLSWNHLQMDDLALHLFQETSIYCETVAVPTTAKGRDSRASEQSIARLQGFLGWIWGLKWGVDLHTQG